MKRTAGNDAILRIASSIDSQARAGGFRRPRRSSSKRALIPFTGTAVDAGRYEGGRIHRTVTMANQPTNLVKIEVIQWSAAPRIEKDGVAPIEIERTN